MPSNNDAITLTKSVSIWLLAIVWINSLKQFHKKINTLKQPPHERSEIGWGIEFLARLSSDELLIVYGLLTCGTRKVSIIG